jgi:hypothetical protein
METPLPVSYLDAARQGRHRLIHFIFGIVLILWTWQVFGLAPLILILLASGALDGPDLTNLDAILGAQPLAGFLAVMSSFVVFFLGIWLVMRLIHGRRLRTLVSPDGQVNWRRFAQGFAVWFGLAAAQALVEALLYPGRYVFDLNPRSFIFFLLPVLLLTPIQTSAEELLFRGYLLQAFGLKLRNWLALCLLSGVLFALPHVSNPEVSVNFWLLMAYYFATGVFLAYITLKDQRLELALGVHAANNIFTALIANYTVTVLPTPALFTIQTLDAVFALLAYLAMVVVFWLVFFRPEFNR